jgi:exosome complex exonuclease DIS3/RRP44
MTVEAPEKPGWTAVLQALHYSARKRKRIGHNLEERYLREDVSCGFLACSSCKPPAAFSLDPETTILVLPDADVLLEYLDVFELPSLSGYVLCTSVIRRVGKFA